MKLALASLILCNMILGGALFQSVKPPQMQVMCPMKVKPNMRGKWLVRYSAQPLAEKRNVA